MDKLLKYFKGFLVFIVSCSIIYFFFFLYSVLSKNNLSLGWTILIVLYLSSISINSFIFFYKSPNTSAKISWYFLISIFPIIGHTFFIFFGRKVHYENSIFKYQEKETFKYEKLNHNFDEKNPYLEILKLQSNLTKRGVYSCKFDFFRTGEDGFRNMFQDIKNAKRYIYAHYYIVKSGEIYNEFKSILLQKAKEGIEIKIIVDDLGRSDLPWDELKFFQKHNIKFYVFKKVLFPFLSTNDFICTHRKFLLIDGKIIHTGGANIGDEYASWNKKFGLWIDCQVKIIGELARSYLLLFIDDWQRATGEKIDFNLKIANNYKKYDTFSTLVEETQESTFKIFKHSLVWWILNAKKTIKIVSPYFIPSRSVMQALKTASLLGVKISIIIPGKAGKSIVHNTTLYWIEKLLKYNINVHVTKNIIIHSKIGIFDDQYAFIGTSNIDSRSFYYQYENNNLLYGKGVAKIIEEYNHYLKYTKIYVIRKKTISIFFQTIISKVISPIF